jgi:putative Ca2+/H+ antiporter (TMEM165/GDT1 family)
MVIAIILSIAGIIIGARALWSERNITGVSTSALLISVFVVLGGGVIAFVPYLKLVPFVAGVLLHRWAQTQRMRRVLEEND